MRFIEIRKLIGFWIVVVGCIALCSGAFTGCKSSDSEGEDKDPCQNANCDPVATCIAEGGSATCICPDGYEDINGDGKECQDIDECVGGLDDCDEVADCQNTEGGYECICPDGYEDVSGDGKVCQDIDECVGGLDDCDEVADCQNTEGGYECICPDGYEDVNGDGTECVQACTPEGESHGVVPDAPECCAGLESVGCDAVDPDTGQCVPCQGATYCTACGDGDCGDGENECRCPEDCEPTNCTPEGESHAVVPDAPECCTGLESVGCDAVDPDTGQCVPCQGATYCTECGDGDCGDGENKCRCPEDCN